MQLFPIYHPAAALYTPAMMNTLREDFGRLPALMSPSAEAPPAPAVPVPAAVPEPVPVGVGADAEPAQLGLF